MAFFKRFSADNVVTSVLVVLVILWTAADALLPPEVPKPPYSAQWALSVAVGAIALALISIQVRLRQARDEGASAESARVTLDRISALELTVEKHARRTEQYVLREAPNEVQGPLIKHELQTLLTEQPSDQWKFRGGSGRWQRDAVLPALSTVRDRDVPYKMLILDLRKDHLCDLYARYRNTHRIGGPFETVESIRLQLTACIVAAGWAAVTSRVRPEIRLTESYSPLRLDLNGNGAMLTVSDPEQPGLFTRSSSWFYRAIDDEFERALEQAPEVKIDKAAIRGYGPTSTLDADAIVAILQNCQVADPGERPVPLFDQPTIESIDVPRLLDISWRKRERA